MIYLDAENIISEIKKNNPKFENENILGDNPIPEKDREEKLEAFIIVYDLFKNKNLKKTKNINPKAKAAQFKGMAESFARDSNNPYKNNLKYSGWVGEIYAAYVLMYLGYNAGIYNGEICFNISWRSIIKMKRKEEYMDGFSIYAGHLTMV